jgi:myo-inositol-1(or 4)-monophosphatase
MAVSPELISDFVEKSMLAARDIRHSVEKFDPMSRRSKTRGSGPLSNQYEIDVLADQIAQRYYSPFEAYVMSEEQDVDKAALDASELVIVVDPIDGSTNASRGVGYWSFAAALIEMGEVVCGVVVDQVQSISYVADLHGARTIDSRNVVSELKVPDVASDVGSRADNFAPSLICYNSHEGSSVPFRHLRNFGSSALAICDVSRGALDAYIDDEDVMLKPWDLLAAEFIATQAGATVKRRDSQGVFAATGVLVTKSDDLISEFRTIFPSFFV